MKASENNSQQGCNKNCAGLASLCFSSGDDKIWGREIKDVPDEIFSEIFNGALAVLASGDRNGLPIPSIRFGGGGDVFALVCLAPRWICYASVAVLRSEL